MKAKNMALTISAMLLISCLSGCTQEASVTGDVQTETPISSSVPQTTVEPTANNESQGGTAAVVQLSATTKDSDTDTTWKESDTKIILNGPSATVSGQGAAVTGNVITITAKGTYVISGTLDNGQIIIAATNTEKVHLVLNGVSITNKSGAAIYASQCDKLIVTLAEGTQNTLTDGGDNFAYNDKANEEPNAALFSKDDLTINGTGSLTVNAGYNNGIGTKDDLLIVSGDITVNAANHGLRGNDSVTIIDGILNITSVNDGINSKNTEDTSLGYILIDGGEFTITASGGYPGQSIKVNKKQMNGGMGGGFVGGNANAAAPIPSPTPTPTTVSETDTVSGKAINASGYIKINNGTFDISSYDDAIHSDVAIIINGGTILLETGATGIQALTVEINNGVIDIIKSYEGIEGENTLTVNAGKISINASDDGISISASSGSFIMNGGNIVITAGTDGIDSNGNINQSGGKVTITVPNMNGGGDGPIDYDGTFTRTGGTMVDVNGNELSTAKMSPGGGMGGRGGRR